MIWQVECIIGCPVTKTCRNERLYRRCMSLVPLPFLQQRRHVKGLDSFMLSSSRNCRTKVAEDVDTLTGKDTNQLSGHSLLGRNHFSLL